MTSGTRKETGSGSTWRNCLPPDGIGNLIALPLQFAPRKAGNSVFIDFDFNPYPDQWQFLSTIRRMPVEAAEEMASNAALQIVELQPEGKRPMSLDAFRNGHRWDMGMRLESLL